MAKYLLDTWTGLKEKKNMHVSIQNFSQNSKVSGKQGFTVHGDRSSKRSKIEDMQHL